MMASAVYILCSLTCAACATLLLRGHLRTGTRLLLWTSLCFMGLALENAVLFIDVVVVPDVDLSPYRNGVSLLSLGLLLFGLVWESPR